jgi:PIN domain nuclease of toxin-antitoxin system
MRLLLDTSILIAVSRDETSQLDRRIQSVMLSPGNESFASIASIWEIAIKTRLGKLDPRRPLGELPGFFDTTGLDLLAIDARHAVAELDPVPDTRDPFDRMLLAQCQVEGLRLVTLDRALVGHPLAWQAS